MQTHYRPLRLNVGFLLSQTAGYGREFDFREERLSLGGDIQLSAFSGHLLLNRTPQGIVAQGNFTATLPAECARCLKDFIIPIPIRLEELFVYPPQNATDALLAVGEDAHLDLEPVLREFMIVNQPSKPLCRIDCKGLCPICGNDLNDEKCSHPAEEDQLTAISQGLLAPQTGPKSTLPQKKEPAAGKSGSRKSVPAKAKKPSAGGKKKTAAKSGLIKKAASGSKPARKPKKSAGTKGKKTAAKKK